MPSAESGDGSERASMAITLASAERGCSRSAAARQRDGSTSDGGGILLFVLGTAMGVLSTVLAYCGGLAARRHLVLRGRGHAGELRPGVGGHQLRRGQGATGPRVPDGRRRDQRRQHAGEG